MRPFNSIGPDERIAAETLAEYAFLGFEPLSGYLAGKERGGKHVCALEDAWSETFGVKHAIAVNSATSGLLAASFAVGLHKNSRFLCPAMTMSATVAAPMFTGAIPTFCDVDDETFGLKPSLSVLTHNTKAAFVTNLFGHPAHLAWWRKTADTHGFYLIEDNAQSPFAMENGKFAGTIGHIGVFSLNIHKPIQCGEGGMITTDDDELARRMRNFINHGENAGDRIGLNLRMPELCAAVAIEQLRRGPEIVGGRVGQAEAILDAIGDIPGLPVIRDGCTHSFYTIPFTFRDDLRTGNSDVNVFFYTARKRAAFCASLREDDIPIVEGYASGPLYRLPAFENYATACPIAEDLHDSRLFYFENCAWDLDGNDIIKIGDAFKRAAEKWL